MGMFHTFKSINNAVLNANNSGLKDRIKLNAIKDGIETSNTVKQFCMQSNDKQKRWYKEQHTYFKDIINNADFLDLILFYSE